MITGSSLRRLAGEEKLNVSMLEKDYVLGWLLFAISSSSISDKLTFKGGTALSKVYFPEKWRLSEDLDFTILDDTDWKIILNALKNEIPKIIQDTVGIQISLRPKPHANPDYLQAKMKYTGPVSPNTIKVEITREKFVGEFAKKAVPKKFDYPKFSTSVYLIETITAEKIRAIIERGYIRDYYDVWKLLKTKNPNKKKTKDLFLAKCKAKGITYSGIDQFFPKDIINKLEPYAEVGLGRLVREPLPTLEKMIEELRNLLTDILS